MWRLSPVLRWIDMVFRFITCLVDVIGKQVCLFLHACEEKFLVITASESLPQKFPLDRF